MAKKPRAKSTKKKSLTVEALKFTKLKDGFKVTLLAAGKK
jgi:hypothetical protein